MRTISPTATIVAIALLLCQGPILALRWQVVLQSRSIDLPLNKLIGVSFVGMFFNQALPSSIGGDAVRAWWIRRSGISLWDAVSSVIIERLSGLLVLLLLVLGGTPFVWQHLDSPVLRSIWAGMSLVAVGAFTGLLAVRLLPKGLRDLAERLRLLPLSDDFRGLLRAGGTTVSLAVLAVLSWSVTIAAVIVLARSQGLTVPIEYFIAVVPMIILIMTIPVSIGGWGAREGAFVLFMAPLGISNADAFLLSVTFGIALIIAALPGSAWWLVDRPTTHGEKDA